MIAPVKQNYKHVKSKKNAQKIYYTYWVFGILAFYGIISGLVWVLAVAWSIILPLIGLKAAGSYVYVFQLAIANYAISVGIIFLLIMMPITLLCDFIAALLKHK